jgi:putative hydrolase of the HAD superfamily
MGNIKAVVFDLGNVVLPISPERTEQAFRDLGIREFEKYYTLSVQTNLFDLLETGKILPETFYQGLREIAGSSLSDSQIEYAWNQIIGDFPLANIQYLQDLGQRIPIYLLSNTNIIHYQYYSELLFKSLGVVSLESLFSKCFLSHEIGLRKPDMAIYSFVTEAIHFQPANILFVDDSEVNINAAKKFGWNTLHFNHCCLQEALTDSNVLC